jgi:glycine/D-amino acid oxidase-like deaminating enzyme
MAQVLIIGAGVIGSAIAWELRRRGTEVAVLESVSEGG